MFLRALMGSRRRDASFPAPLSSLKRQPQRWRKFISYYRPHLRLLAADLCCAALVAATAVALPLLANFVLAHLPTLPASQAMPQLVGWGSILLAVVLVQALATYFVDYRGHVMGARIEAQVRRELQPAPGMAPAEWLRSQMAIAPFAWAAAVIAPMSRMRPVR